METLILLIPRDALFYRRALNYLILRYFSTLTSMESATSTTVKTFKARLYDITSQGEVFVGKVIVTIDPCEVNMNGLSSRFYLKDIVEMDELPTFNILDFPDQADQPAIDIQGDCISTLQPSTVPANVHADLINSLDDDLIDLPDFENVDQVIDDFGLTVEQEEALINDENVNGLL